MRITANIPDNIGRVVKTFADNEKAFILKALKKIIN